MFTIYWNLDSQIQCLLHIDTTYLASHFILLYNMPLWGVGIIWLCGWCCGLPESKSYLSLNSPSVLLTPLMFHVSILLQETMEQLLVFCFCWSSSLSTGVGGLQFQRVRHVVLLSAGYWLVSYWSAGAQLVTIQSHSTSIIVKKDAVMDIMTE